MEFKIELSDNNDPTLDEIKPYVGKYIKRLFG